MNVGAVESQAGSSHGSFHGAACRRLCSLKQLEIYSAREGKRPVFNQSARETTASRQKGPPATAAFSSPDTSCEPPHGGRLKPKRELTGRGRPTKVEKTETLKQCEAALLSCHCHQHGWPLCPQAFFHTVPSMLFLSFKPFPSLCWLVGCWPHVLLHYTDSVKWIKFRPWCSPNHVSFQSLSIVFFAHFPPMLQFVFRRYR